MDKVFFAARYGRGDDDYINCPFDKEGYEKFAEELANAESVELKEFEKRDFKVYEGCMPIEVMARRGADTMRFGPLKPVGLRDPKTGHRPWAAVQLRRENEAGTLYNIVGFQTNLKFPEQKRVFSMIPGLEHAVFARYGVMHRNTFMNSPKLLHADFSLRSDPRIFFAGQMTGVEGYMESASSGLHRRHCHGTAAAGTSPAGAARDHHARRADPVYQLVHGGGFPAHGQQYGHPAAPSQRRSRARRSATARLGCPCHAGSGTDPERFGGISYENYR